MRRFDFLAVFALILSGSSFADDDGWRKELTDPAPGSFPEIPTVRMKFSFGWSDLITAAKADAVLARNGADWKLLVQGRSLGLARTLWPMDATHRSTINRESLLPIAVDQFEKYRNRTVDTKLRFDAEGVRRHRSVSKEATKWKRVDFPSIRDVIGGVLFVRSLPLTNGDEVGLVSFPGDSPYFVRVTVEGRETVRCMEKDWPAIRLRLEVQKLEVEDNVPTNAVDYRKFKSGTVWVSDDKMRLPLRAEARIFIGFVYGELISYELIGKSSTSR